MSKILILGDVHIGKAQSIGKPGIGNILNSRIQDQVNLLNWVLQQAIENNVFNIIITGDVFEEAKPHPTLISLLIEWLKKCEAYNIDVHIIMGNHDLIRSGNFYQSALDIVANFDMDNVKVYKTIETFHLEGVSFTMMPFKDRRSMGLDSHDECFSKLKSLLDYESAEIINTNVKVLIGHLAVKGSIPVGDEIDDVSNELLCPLNLFEDYNFVWMGHIHKPQICNEKPYIAHIGSMDLSDYGETDHTKIIVLFDTDNPKYFTELPLPTRKLRKIQLSIPEQENATQYLIDFILQESNKKSFKDAIVRLEIKLANRNSDQVNRNVVEQFLYDQIGIHYISNFSETKSTAVINVTDDGNVVNNTMDINTAVKIYAEKLIDTDEEIKNLFITEANSIIKTYTETLK